MILASYKRLLNQSWKYIKSKDTEEKFDLYFTRPCGYVLMLVAHKIHLTPNQVSALRVLAALLAAITFSYRENVGYSVIASFFLLLSSVLDSTDGMLARMTNTASETGHIVEAISDTLATFLIYLGILWPYIINDGIGWLVIACFSIASHGLQSSILFFHHSDYRYFGDGLNSPGNWNPSIEDVKAKYEKDSHFAAKCIECMLVCWALPQMYLAGRKQENRLKWKSIVDGKDTVKKAQFMKNYREINLPLLSMWRLQGAMFHWLCLIVFSLFGLFLEFIVFNSIILNLLLPVFSLIQYNKDKKLVAETEAMK